MNVIGIVKTVAPVLFYFPELDELIAFALNSKKDLTQLKKAGAACLELTRISPPAGSLVWLSTPKILRKSGKAD